MLKRTVVGLILVIIVLAVTLWTPPVFLAVFASVVSAVAANEFLYNTGLVKNGRMRFYSMIMAFLVPLWCYFGSNGPAALVGVLVFYMLLVLELLISKTKLPFAQVGFCLVGGLLFPYLISALVRISLAEHGSYMVMLPFTISFMTDIGAYIIGITMGKHKLCPTVSPKKTVEGFVGGIVFAVISAIIFALVLQVFFGFRVNYFYAVLYGIVGSLAAVLGDLSFSVIKRQTGIKDYGYLIPGHGGALDRFDSIMMVSPLVEALLLLLPMAARC